MTAASVPLEDAVVFPHMNVTLTVDTASEERVLLVPKHEGEFARSAPSQGDRPRAPAGRRNRRGAHGVLIVRVAGAAESDARGRLFVEVEERPDDIPTDQATRDLEREYRAVVEESSSCAATTAASQRSSARSASPEPWPTRPGTRWT